MPHPHTSHPTLTKSCTACRLSKCRCENELGLAACKRCERLGLRCIFVTTKRGQPNKKRDIARLGAAVRALLRDEGAIPPTTPTPGHYTELEVALEAVKSAASSCLQRRLPTGHQDEVQNMLAESIRNLELVTAWSHRDASAHTESPAARTESAPDTCDGRLALSGVLCEVCAEAWEVGRGTTTLPPSDELPPELPPLSVALVCSGDDWMDVLHDSPVSVDQTSSAAGSSADHQAQTARPSSPRARPLDVCSGESAPSPSFPPPPAFQPRATRSFVGTLASALEPLQPEDGASVDPIMPMLHHAHQPVPAGICSWWRHAQQESQTMFQQGHYESDPPLGVERMVLPTRAGNGLAPVLEPLDHWHRSPVGCQSITFPAAASGSHISAFPMASAVPLGAPMRSNGTFGGALMPQSLPPSPPQQPDSSSMGVAATCACTGAGEAAYRPSIFKMLLPNSVEIPLFTYAGAVSMLSFDCALAIVLAGIAGVTVATCFGISMGSIAFGSVALIEALGFFVIVAAARSRRWTPASAASMWHLLMFAFAPLQCTLDLMSSTDELRAVLGRIDDDIVLSLAIQLTCFVSGVVHSLLPKTSVSQKLVFGATSALTLAGGVLVSEYKLGSHTLLASHYVHRFILPFLFGWTLSPGLRREPVPQSFN